MSVRAGGEEERDVPSDWAGRMWGGEGQGSGGASPAAGQPGGGTDPQHPRGTEPCGFCQAWRLGDGLSGMAGEGPSLHPHRNESCQLFLKSLLRLFSSLVGGGQVTAALWAGGGGCHGRTSNFQLSARKDEQIKDGGEGRANFCCCCLLALIRGAEASVCEFKFC